jgi:hypothetical protein
LSNHLKPRLRNRRARPCVGFGFPFTPQHNVVYSCIYHYITLDQ